MQQLPVPYSASEWIAHKAAMCAKRPLLRGEPDDIVPRWYEVVGWAIALPGFVAVMMTLGRIGGF